MQHNEHDDFQMVKVENDDHKKLLETVQSQMNIFLDAYEKATYLFDDKEKARIWLFEKNTYFFNMSPFEYIMGNKGQAVIDMLNERGAEEV